MSAGGVLLAPLAWLLEPTLPPLSATQIAGVVLVLVSVWLGTVRRRA